MLEHPSVRNMSESEKMEAQFNVAMKDVNTLKEWLLASGRRWLVLDSLDLVDSLSWPNDIRVLMQIFALYRAHRATLPNGRVEHQEHPDTGEPVVIPLMKSDVLEPEEKKLLVQEMLTQIRQEEPTWSPV